MAAGDGQWFHQQETCEQRVGGPQGLHHSRAPHPAVGYTPPRP